MSMVAREHVLLLGPPGVAKSLAVDEVLFRIEGAKIGSFQLSKGASQSELIGPMSIRAMKEEDRFRFNTTGMLPDVEYAIVDEIFKANALTLNKALRILAEGQFDNGGERVHSKLRWMASTSNEIGDALELSALYDRILVRLVVDRVADPENRTRMIGLGLNRRRGLQTYEPMITAAALEELQEARHEIDIPDEVHNTHLQLWQELDRAGFVIGDRRDVGSMALGQARALLAGRRAMVVDDLDVFRHTVWNDPEEIREVNKIVVEVVNPDMHEVMNIVDAVEDGYETMLTERKATDNVLDQVAASSRFLKAAQSQRSLLGDIITKLATDNRDTTIARQALVKLDLRMRQSTSFQAS